MADLDDILFERFTTNSIDKGQIPVGIRKVKDNGNPLDFKQNRVVSVRDTKRFIIYDSADNNYKIIEFDGHVALVSAKMSYGDSIEIRVAKPQLTESAIRSDGTVIQYSVAEIPNEEVIRGNNLDGKLASTIMHAFKLKSNMDGSGQLPAGINLGSDFLDHHHFYEPIQFYRDHDVSPDAISDIGKKGLKIDNVAYDDAKGIWTIDGKEYALISCKDKQVFARWLPKYDAIVFMKPDLKKGDNGSGFTFNSQESVTAPRGTSLYDFSAAQLEKTIHSPYMKSQRTGLFRAIHVNKQVEIDGRIMTVAQYDNAIVYIYVDGNPKKPNDAGEYARVIDRVTVFDSSMKPITILTQNELYNLMSIAASHVGRKATSWNIPG